MQQFLRKYGVQTTIHFVLYEVDGVDLRVNAVDAGADCTITKDEGAETTCANDFADEGTGYSLVISATEMEFAEGMIYIVDSATKQWLDEVLKIETYGHASAMHAMDLDTTVPTVGEIQAEMEENAASILDSISDLLPASTIAAASDIPAMVGTNGANTTTPPTVGEIQTEIEENGASLLDTIRDAIQHGTYGLSAIETLVDELETRLSAARAGYLDNLSAGAVALASALTTHDGKLDTVDGNVDAILLDTGSDGVVLKAAGLAADAVDEILDEVIEGTITFRQAMRLCLAALAGKTNTGGTVFRNTGDSKPRITATVDASGNRTAMTLDGT